MNEHDKENLNFLLNSSPEVLADWYSKMAKDDIDYALHLIAAYKQELSLREEEFIEVNDLTEANAVLSRFML